MTEENSELQEPENTGEPDSTVATETPATQETDWEKRYKDLQADNTKTHQRLAAVERRFSEPTPEPEAEETEYDEPFLDPKTAKKMIDKRVNAAVKQVRMESADSYFRRTYPDVVKHEHIIAGILRDPSLEGSSHEERIDAAVKQFNSLTAEAKTEAVAEVEAKNKEREKKNKMASGLGGPSTTPVKSDEGDISDADEIKARKSRQAKQRGIA